MNKLPSVPSNPVSMVVSSSQDIINAWRDYANTRELEITKREQIKANRDVALSQIQAQAETLRLLIAGTFAERAKNFDAYFNLLEAGFVNSNEHQVNAAIELIVEQTKCNPMAQAAHIINKINDPDNNDLIEI